MYHILVFLGKQEPHGHDDVAVRVGLLELDGLALRNPSRVVDQAAKTLPEESQRAFCLHVPDLDGEII